MKEKILSGLAVITAVIPTVAFGADPTGPTLGGLITNLANTILDPLVGIALTVALVVFFWGMVKYIKSLGSEKDKIDGKAMMFWGVIALFVMVSVWGLVNLVSDTLTLDNTPRGNLVLPGSSNGGGGGGEDGDDGFIDFDELP